MFIPLPWFKASLMFFDEGICLVKHRGVYRRPLYYKLYYRGLRHGGILKRIRDDPTCNRILRVLGKLLSIHRPGKGLSKRTGFEGKTDARCAEGVSSITSSRLGHRWFRQRLPE